MTKQGEAKGESKRSAAFAIASTGVTDSMVDAGFEQVKSLMVDYDMIDWDPEGDDPNGSMRAAEVERAEGAAKAALKRAYLAMEAVRQGLATPEELGVASAA
jgi:hypothetical protein